MRTVTLPSSVAETHWLPSGFQDRHPKITVRVHLVAFADSHCHRDVHESPAPPADDHLGATGHRGVHRGLREPHTVNAVIGVRRHTADGVARVDEPDTGLKTSGGEVLSASASGADLVVLAALAPVYPYLFEVSPDIKTVDDLRGKKVGVSSPGGSADIASRVALKKQGLDPDVDVTFVAVDSHANRTAALISGAIQAGVDDPPDSFEVERHGLHPLFDLAALKLPAAQTVLTGQRAWVNANRETTQKFVDSLVQGIARMRADKPFTIGVLKKYFDSDDEEAMSGAYDFFVKEVTQPAPFVRPEHFADAAAILGEKNDKIKTVDLSRVIDASFVQSAVDRGLAAPQ